MMSTKLRLKRAAAAGILCAFALALQGAAQAADSLVPQDWNVAPMTSGAYREAFDTTLPGWAGRTGVSALTDVFATMSGSALPARSNAWFGANAKVMQLDTDGTVISNMLAHTDNSAVGFATKPVFVDMRVRFDAMTDSPDPALLDSTRLAVFVSSDAKLVAVHAGGVSTNAIALDTNQWYQLTIRMTNTTFDVLMNDAVVFKGLPVKSAGTTLAGVSLYGTGLVDEMYVSHGNPAYAIAGPTAAILAPLPAPGSNPPTEEQQTLINAWLNGYPSLTVLDLTQDQLSTAYLMNTLTVEGTTGKPVAYNFGISAIDLVTPTLLVVTVALDTNGSGKSGPINGKIQLLGKVNYGDALWTTLSGAITPAYADFTGGKATYTFAIPADGYKFFKPQIVP